MQDRSRIVAGTALALVMLAGTAYAAPRTGIGQPVDPVRQPAAGASLLLAQAEEELTEEEIQRRLEREAQEEQTPVPEPAPEQPAPSPEEAPPPPEQTPPPPEQTPPPPEEAPQPPEEAPQPPEQAPPPPAEEPASPAPEEVPAAPEQPEQPEQPTSGAEPVPGEPAPPAEQAPPPAAEEAPEQPPAQETPPPPAEQPAPPASGAEPIPGQPTPPADEAPPPPAEGAAPQPPAQDTPPPAEDGGAEPVPGQPAPPAAEQPPTPPPGQDAPPAGGGAEPVGDTAPLLDSAKEAGDVPPAPTAGETAPPPAEAAPPPVSDQEAQQFEAPVEVQSLRAEEGRRIERREERRERREGANVLREIGDRFVIQLGNQVIVQSDDRGRIGRNAEDVYYEELPRGRTRETIVRQNGVQVVTVYDRYGDVIRRSRFTPDGREYVLVYADERREREREDRREWRDPGRDLPPLRLTIPASEYILDAGSVHDDDIYYDFLDQPPVEPVRRLYSIDEVRYSARVRDSVRRVELDTITFDTGSATISESAIPRLDGVARAMERLLEENPGEVFLIEGHTDAVGSDESNLALSDRRAEGVAAALTGAFGIPPENLVTQGYGERYLKINTGQAERENRRVAIRRITPLVAPVASAR